MDLPCSNVLPALDGYASSVEDGIIKAVYSTLRGVDNLCACSLLPQLVLPKLSLSRGPLSTPTLYSSKVLLEHKNTVMFRT